MNDSPRRRWVSLGELIALAALIISGFGVWISWQGSRQKGPTPIVEQRTAIPLTLRGTVERDGRALVIAPVEASHAIESLSLTIRGSRPISVASDGRVDARDVETALNDTRRGRKGSQSTAVRIDARYVEAGAERRRSASYVLHYRWEGGGLFGGRSLRLTA